MNSQSIICSRSPSIHPQFFERRRQLCCDFNGCFLALCKLHGNSETQGERARSSENVPHAFNKFRQLATVEHSLPEQDLAVGLDGLEVDLGQVFRVCIHHAPSPVWRMLISKASISSRR